jgi:hypothetical protein
MYPPAVDLPTHRTFSFSRTGDCLVEQTESHVLVGLLLLFLLLLLLGRGSLAAGSSATSSRSSTTTTTAGRDAGEFRGTFVDEL